MPQDARLVEEQATQKRAAILGLRYINTQAMREKPLFKDLLTSEEMYRLRIVPIKVTKFHVDFGITNNTSQQTIKQIKDRFSDQTVDFGLISDTGFDDYMRLYNPPRKVVYEDVKFSDEENKELFAQVTATLDKVLADDILGYLVKQTYQLKGSDIHLECQKEAVRVRLRVDGVLHPIAVLSYAKYKQLLSVIAVVANVSTNSRTAQTGHINKVYKLATGEEVTVNLRVETIPSAYGMDVVMRLFNLHMELLNIDNLGLSKDERNVVDKIIHHPTGMVLMVGPTGSGKTTTLYSLINTLNSTERKIITLEDPIEYFLKGVVQIPVSGDMDRAAFAEMFRALLRVDPDIVMVGEIRDQDTAKTALQASLTGHLVLSTFHAASASAALTRMLDFIGVNPLFASAMQLIMAQRLLRRLDNETKKPYKPDEALKKQLNTVLDTLPSGVKKPDLDKATLYKPGKSKDNPFGYRGQMAIREQLQMTPGVQKLLRLPPGEVTTEMIEKKATEDGMLTMLQDGILKALNGETTLDEVYRVVS